MCIRGLVLLYTLMLLGHETFSSVNFKKATPTNLNYVAR